MSTFLQLCQRFHRDTGITGSEMSSVANQVGMNKKIVNWISDSDNEIQNLWQDWKFLRVDGQVISIVSGTSSYSLATLAITNLVRWDPEHFHINPGTANYAPLSEMKYSDWLNSAARLGTAVSAQPSRFVIKPDNSLVFIDQPNANYTVWGSYFKSITKMTANADTSNIPAPYEDIIIYRAQIKYAIYYEDDDLYNQATNDYNMALMKLEAAELPEQHIRTTSANVGDDVRIVVE